MAPIAGMGKICGGRGLTLLVLFAATLSACGLDRDRTIDQFFHTAWNIGDGAPSGITQMAQTTDGYLWLGTQTGLVRFDGIRFERYRPLNRDLPSNTVTSLLATPDGGLWIGFVPHGAAFLSRGRIITYGESDGLPLAPVYALGRDADGAIWAGTTRGISRFDGGHWHTAGADWGLPEVRTDQFLLDRDGRLWVSTLDGLYFLPAHERKFHYGSPRPAQLAQSRDGTLWMAEGRTISGSAADFTAQSHGTSTTIMLSANGLLVDGDDTLWILTRAEGIARIANPESIRGMKIESSSKLIERFGQEQGLSDDRITDAVEDREGNIWVASRGGLDRFRRSNLVPGPFPYGSQGQDLALVPDQEGAIWAGNLDQPLMRFKNNALSFLGESRNITCQYRDPDGSLWFGEDNGLLHYVAGNFESLTLPRQINPRLRWGVQAITRDRAGDLWVSVSENGVFRLHDGEWTQWGNLTGLPRRTAVSLWTDPRGRVWFGYTVNEVAVLDGTSVHTYASPDGVNIGTVAAFGGDADHVWAGGERGLAVFDGRQFHMLATDLEGGIRGVSGIVETQQGDLWINQGNGVVHLSAREKQRWLIDFHHPVQCDLFDFRDGFPGSASPVRPLPSEVVAMDGRIWLSGTSGTAWIDPAQIYRNPLPPPVAIESILVDDRQYELNSPATLPALPSDIEIQYTALSLSIPERVRFRYQLEGYDKGWQDAGNRRSAFYTDLGPGHYRFRVIACNNDGVWNETGAGLDFSVPPAWFQTWWFTALWVLSVAAVLWLLYLVRLGQISAQMQSRLKERLAERERIARELHDTLLQGIQALVLRFQAAANQIAAGHPALHMMNEALDNADQVMLEGRRRVTDLRAGAEPPHALAQALRAAGEELARDRAATSFRLEVHGKPGELHPLVYEEAYWIGREALLNAFYHAEADNIRAELNYGYKELQLRFVDDGRGIDPQVLNEGGRPGHWGMRGMRERADKIGARLEIVSRHGEGTHITVRIPSAAAYRYGAIGWFWRRPPRPVPPE